jgi:hypothetical protein
VLLVVAIGGFFSGCAATRDWVNGTLKEAITTVKAESKGALDTVVANLLNSLKEQGKKLMADVPSIAKDAAAKLLATLEAKRKEAQAKEAAKIDVELAKVVPDLSYDTNHDGAVTSADFLDAQGDLTVGAATRLTLYYVKQAAKPGEKKDSGALAIAVAALAGLTVGGGATAALQKKVNGNGTAPAKAA